MEIGLHEELKGLANEANVSQGTAATILLKLGIATHRARVKILKDKADKGEIDAKQDKES